MEGGPPARHSPRAGPRPSIRVPTEPAAARDAPLRNTGHKAGPAPKRCLPRTGLHPSPPPRSASPRTAANVPEGQSPQNALGSPSRPQLPGKVSTALRMPRPPVPRPGAPTPVPALATLRQRAGGAHRGRGRRGPRRAARGAFPRRPCARSLPGSQSQSLCAEPEPEPGRQGRWRGEARRGAPASRRSRAAGAPPAGARRLGQ